MKLWTLPITNTGKINSFVNSKRFTASLLPFVYHPLNATGPHSERKPTDLNKILTLPTDV